MTKEKSTTTVTFWSGLERFVTITSDAPVLPGKDGKIKADFIGKDKVDWFGGTHKVVYDSERAATLRVRY
jgi:hypothetical protein